MSSTAFVKMVEAYRDTLGKAYPRQDMVAVVMVFRECADHEAATQNRMCQTTRVEASNLSKILKSGRHEGWIRTASRGANGTKEVSLTAKGRKTLDGFESRCVAACSEATKTARSRAGRGGTPKSVQKKGREGFLNMYNEDGTARIP